MSNDTRLSGAMPSGMTVANFSIATSEQWKDKQSGEKKERTEWHRLCAFGRTAEIVGEYLKKGSKVYVEGSLRTRKWQDKQGEDRYMTEIVVNEMQMLDGKPAGQRGNTRDDGNDEYPRRGGNGNRPNDGSGGKGGEFDDDIPF